MSLLTLFYLNIGCESDSLLGNISWSMTLSSKHWKDIKINSDGTFIVKLGTESANGRENYIQTHIDAKFLFIRDCLSDWHQIPNAYFIKRLSDPSTALPLTVEQMADRAARYMVHDVAPIYWFMRTMQVLKPNVVNDPFDTGSIGGLVGQRIIFMHLELAEDEAYVITLSSGDAKFRNLVLYDFWFRTLDYWNHNSSMNNSQSRANSDGSTTYVISAVDPGIHNWLDTQGLSSLLVTHRWQGCKSDLKEDVWGKGTLVKIQDIKYKLPKEIARVTSVERQAQIADRQTAFNLRYVC